MCWAFFVMLGGFLTAAQQQATAYTALTATSLGFGAIAIAVPQLLLSLVTADAATPVNLVFTRIAGVTMAISAAAEYSLKVKAVN